MVEKTVAQAVAELKRLQARRADNMLRTVERTPKFADYVTVSQHQSTWRLRVVLISQVCNHETGVYSKGLAPFSYMFHHPMCAHSHTGSIGD